MSVLKLKYRRFMTWSGARTPFP